MQPNILKSKDRRLGRKVGGAKKTEESFSVRMQRILLENGDPQKFCKHQKHK